MHCIDLRLFNNRYRLGWDASREGRERDPWLLIICGRYGRIFPWGGSKLAVYSTHPRVFDRLQELPTAEAEQEGHAEATATEPGLSEIVVTFDVSQLHAVATVIQVPIIRRHSPARRAAAAQTLAPYRFGSKKATTSGAKRTCKPATP